MANPAFLCFLLLGLYEVHRFFSCHFLKSLRSICFPSLLQDRLWYSALTQGYAVVQMLIHKWAYEGRRKMGPPHRCSLSSHVCTIHALWKQVFTTCVPSTLSGNRHFLWPKEWTLNHAWRIAGYGHCSMCCTQINSFNLHNNPMR